MLKQNKTKNWSEEFDEMRHGLKFLLEVRNFGAFEQTDYTEIIKSFIKNLLSTQRTEVLEEVENKVVSHIKDLAKYDWISYSIFWEDIHRWIKEELKNKEK